MHERRRDYKLNIFSNYSNDFSMISFNKTVTLYSQKRKTANLRQEFVTILTSYAKFTTPMPFDSKIFNPAIAMGLNYLTYYASSNYALPIMNNKRKSCNYLIKRT